MNRTVSVVLLSAMLLFIAGCKEPPGSRTDPPIPTAEALNAVSSGPKPEGAAPDKFKVLFETTKGNFIVEATRNWSPNGVDRFHELVTIGFFDDVAFFRVIDGFMAQFGINGNPEEMVKWRDANITDDPVIQSNKRGYVTFAKSGAPNSRSTQLFINFGDNSSLDGQGFSPFGQVIEGMDVVDSLYSGYGEGAPSGRGPNQQRVQYEGNEYLQKEFPNLDYVKKARILTDVTAEADSEEPNPFKEASDSKNSEKKEIPESEDNEG